MSLRVLIHDMLHEKGAIPFVEFMHQALYAPNLGYYSAGLQKFGIDGDFVTAPELTPLFGQALANQCQQVLCCLEAPIVFEFGAGSGKLCVDLLSQLEHLESLPREYHILEVSAHLQRRQQAFISSQLPHLVERVKWISRWPEHPFSGVVIANEVLDAMPVHRFLRTETEFLESYVTFNAENELMEVFKPSKDPRLTAYLEKAFSGDRYPYQSEANLFLEDWIRHCYAMLLKGAFFMIDYGFPRHEYYHPDRHQGTLMCHYRHRSHPNPFLHLGEQDITAHVDFTHVAEAGYAAGFHVAGYTNQASFLLALGLLSLVDGLENPRERLRSQQAVKQLLQPSEMGELFKVIGLTKAIDIDLMGFQLQDKRASL